MYLINPVSESSYQHKLMHYLAPMMCLLFFGNWILMSLLESSYPNLLMAPSSQLFWGGVISAIVSVLTFHAKKS